MLIESFSSVLEADVMALFGKIFFQHAGQSFQVRMGRYVVNGHTYPYECLLLNEHDDVIDGFCGSAIPWLQWKGLPFVDHLLKLKRMDEPSWYNDLLDFDPEVLDKQHWRMELNSEA